MIIFPMFLNFKGQSINLVEDGKHENRKFRNVYFGAPFNAQFLSPNAFRQPQRKSRYSGKSFVIFFFKKEEDNIRG